MTEKEFRTDIGKIIICAIKLEGYYKGVVLNKLINELVAKLNFEEDKNE